METQEDIVNKLKQKVNSLFEKNSEQKVLEPYLHLKKLPIKEMRSKLLYGLNEWMNIPLEKLQIIEKIVNLLYEGIIILDDTLDSGEYRRGIPTAHRIFGNNRTIISSFAVLTLTINELLTLNNTEVIQIYVDEFLRFYEGLTEEIYFQQINKCPTFEEYFENIKLRTQVVLNFPFRLMQAFSDCKKDYTRLAELFSKYYQILNDYSSLHSDDGNWDRRGMCDDISDGKFTFPIIHAIRSGTLEGEEVLHIINQRTKDAGLKKYCLHLIEKLGSLEFAKRATLEYEKKLRDEIDRLGGNSKLQHVVDLVKEWKNDDTTADKSTFLVKANLIEK